MSVVATPWDQALANRVPLNLGAVASSTLDAKLAMAEVVLRSADPANRKRQGLAEGGTQGLPAEETQFRLWPVGFDRTATRALGTSAAGCRPR